MSDTVKVKASIREGGVTYRTPLEAFTAADEIEHDAQRRADEYRANGDEGMADTTVDRGREKAERLRAWARQREEHEARATEQPPDVPAAPERRRQNRAGASSRRRYRRGGGTFGGRGGAIARRGYTRSGAQASVRAYGTLGWEVAGWTVGLALLFLFLSPRGAKSFGELANLAAAALGLIVDPVDPLQPKLLDTYAAQVGPPPPAPKPTRPPANRRASRSRGVLV